MKVLITKEAFLKMQSYIDLCEYEISGMGKVKVLESGDLLVTDIRLWDQKVTGTHVDLDQDFEYKFMMQLVEEGEDPNDWKVWWHSHVDMNVFWSSVDTKTMNDIMKVGQDERNSSPDFLLSIVGNKKAEYKVRLDAAVRNDIFGIKGIETRDDLTFERLVEPELEVKIQSIQSKINKEKEKIEKIEERMEVLNNEIEDLLVIEDSEGIEDKCEKDIEAHVIKPVYNYKFNNEHYGAKI